MMRSLLMLCVVRGHRPVKKPGGGTVCGRCGQPLRQSFRGRMEAK
jgi:hypothetical protein